MRRVGPWRTASRGQWAVIIRHMLISYIWMDRIESCEDTQVRFMHLLVCEETTWVRVSIQGYKLDIEITVHNKRYLGETFNTY